MKNFLFVFRADWGAMASASEAETQARTKSWMDWIGSIAAQNKLVDQGNRLEASGKVVKPKGSVTDGPYAEIKESIGGYSIVKAASYDEAVKLAQGCPMLHGGVGSVEVRELGKM
jgi:hypothetical protein